MEKTKTEIWWENHKFLTSLIVFIIGLSIGGIYYFFGDSTFSFSLRQGLIYGVVLVIVKCIYD